MSLPARERSRRRRVGQALLVVVVVAATSGILALVAQSAVLLGRMTTEVSAAQQRTTTLSNAQREGLRLLQALTDLGEGTDVDAVVVQRGLFVQQLRVSAARFPTGSPQATELQEVKGGIARFPWERLEGADRQDAITRTAMVMVAQCERRVKALYEEQEKFFYSATLDSLEAKARSQMALVVLVVLVLVLGVAWVVMLNRRTRGDVALAYEALRASEQRFRSLVQGASDLTAVTDSRGTLGYLSPAVEGLLGYQPDELLGQQLLDHVDPDSRDGVTAALAGLVASPGEVVTVELRIRTRDARWRTIEAVCRNLLDDPAVHGIVWNGRDVTDRRALEDLMTYQAFHDPLTGLPNRALFLERLQGALSGDVPAGGGVSVVLVDLDGFKNVNDTLGHAAGDELLRRVGERLTGCILASDTVARLGGDEFAVVVLRSDPDHALAVSRRVVAALQRPVRVAREEVSIGASVGVAHAGGHTRAEDLLRDADIAMYAAKNAGKGRVEQFEPVMRDRTAERTALQQQLARAVDLGEIEVHYQPIVDVRTERVTAVEALARWRHPDRGLVPPVVFIPVAEESGVISDIGREVLGQACRRVGQWRADVPGCDGLGLTVNVSGRQVLSGHLPEDVAAALAHSGLPAESLMLEITETMLLDESDVVAAELGRLKRLGVRLAVDDFGAGYSSLSSLMLFDADVVKIDRTFLDFDTARQGSLVHAVSELGHTLGLTVVAEGVETAEHLEMARMAECDAAQGYHFSRPLPPMAAEAFLARAAAAREAGIVR